MISKTPIFRCVAAISLMLIATPSVAYREMKDEVNAVFHQFIAAQNAHDLKIVGSILQDSPETLWVARGQAIWGRQAMLEKFAENYKGVCVLEPDFKRTRIVSLSPAVAQLFAPATTTIAPSGQVAAPRRFLLTQTYVKTLSGWKLATIVTKPAAAQQ